MKVFELAKELNVGAVDLVDKLRASGINVKNHMVTLTEEELASAKKLFEPARSDKPIVKKVIKKKVTKLPEQTSEQLVQSTTEAKTDHEVLAQPAEVKDEVELSTIDGKKVLKKSVMVKRKTKKDLEDEQIALKEEQISAAEAGSSFGAQVVEEDSEEALEDVVKNFYEEDRPRGLEIVSRPEIKTTSKPETPPSIKKN